MSRVFGRVKADCLDEVFAAAVQRRVADLKPRPQNAALELATKESDFPWTPFQTSKKEIEHKGADTLGIPHR
jgi:hypothetical protein